MNPDIVCQIGYRLIQFTNGLNLTTEGSAIFSSNYFLTSTNDELVKQDGFVKLDARVSLATDDGPWAFDVIGNNLNNRTIKTFSQALPTTVGSTYAAKQRPRNFVVQVRYKW